MNGEAEVMLFALGDSGREGDDDEEADEATDGFHAAVRHPLDGGDKMPLQSVSLMKRRRSQHFSIMPTLKITGSSSRSSSGTSVDSGFGDEPGSATSSVSSVEEILSPRLKWQRALKLIRHLKDPWEEHFQSTQLPVERVKRHRYNALKKQWTEDETYVQMQTEPFGHGAMRECYRMKKVGSKKDKKRSRNFVAKRYMEEVETSVYFEDVRLQMDAKLWGEDYNRHQPPKKVDIFQVFLVEFVERPGRPLYHLENFIEGNYVKYNSNSGYVDDHVRCTPQAFSHFTFEQSGHELIVVDIQGVDDLWTDPQIHTADHDGYGDGNLGLGGMALFFHSHVCNSICESLGLSKFDLAPSEIKQQNTKVGVVGETVVRGQEVHVTSPALLVDRTNLLARLMRCSSLTMQRISECENGDTEEGELDLTSPAGSIGDSILPSRRTRYISTTSDDTATSVEDEEQMAQLMRSRHSRSSCVSLELQSFAGDKTQLAECILGKVHHSLAVYHELGRFGQEVDWEAAGYHARLAAQLGVQEAMLTVARLVLGLPHELLTGCTSIQGVDENTAVTFMLRAAEGGDRSAMVYMAQAYTTGTGLGTERRVSHKEATEWYQRAIAATQGGDDTDDYDATIDYPLYTLQAKVAELYMEGGPDLDPDYQAAADMYNEAAENATNAMKGRLASQYYMKAEEAASMVEE